jgi:hypothetical protein
MTATVLIQGEGIAAYCCWRLLRDADIDIKMETAKRPNLPAVMLGKTSQKLLQDVFNRQDLFVGFPEIRRRVVAWGTTAKAVVLPHSAVVVPEKDLLDRIRTGFEQDPERGAGKADWTIFAASPLPPASVEYQIGSRPAAAAAVTLQVGCDAQACWIESLDNGWLFLLPSGKHTGWLLSVGDTAESLLEMSRLIQEQIVTLSPAGGIFSSHPRISFPLSAPGWLACGTAALGFDPLCGDGAGNAVREAILGAAVVRAAIAGGSEHSLIAHYQARLLAGFQRHVAACLDFYKSGSSGTWWDRQLDDLKQGLTWCSEQLMRLDPSRYRLNGFTLEAVE